MKKLKMWVDMIWLSNSRISVETVQVNDDGE